MLSFLTRIEVILGLPWNELALQRSPDGSDKYVITGQLLDALCSHAERRPSPRARSTEVTQYRVVTGAVELNSFLRRGWKYVEVVSSTYLIDRHPTDPQGGYCIDRFLISTTETL